MSLFYIPIEYARLVILSILFITYKIKNMNSGEIIHVQILLFQLRIYLNLLSPHMSITYKSHFSYVPTYLFMAVNKRDKISSF